jgi:hypothetical protein
MFSEHQWVVHGITAHSMRILLAYVGSLSFHTVSVAAEVAYFWF